MRMVATRQQFEDPGWLKQLFGNPLFGFGWFFLRLYLGFQWLEAGWHKVSGDGWMNQNGAALQAFWTRIVQVPEKGTPPITYGWYRDFIQFMLDHHWYTWFAKLVAMGELLVGIALVVGAFTAIAAFFGAALNFNFMLAGSASTNPVLFGIAILLILAWKTAGYVGVDRWLLPALGTPWQPGKILHRTAATGGTPRRRPAGAAGAGG
jgi:thiosulfate dehydrogenase [quinone] large subunit